MEPNGKIKDVEEDAKQNVMLLITYFPLLCLPVLRAFLSVLSHAQMIHL
jgi:hypothetical protein